MAPELVLELDGSNRMYLYSDKFSPLLVEAIKELNSRIERLEAEIAAYRH